MTHSPVIMANLKSLAKICYGHDTKRCKHTRTEQLAAPQTNTINFVESLKLSLCSCKKKNNNQNRLVGSIVENYRCCPMKYPSSSIGTSSSSS